MHLEHVVRVVNVDAVVSTVLPVSFVSIVALVRHFCYHSCRSFAMKCVLLAAGYATRMYPLTLNFPKPLLEIKGKTILDWMVDDLASGGKISQYIVISNHKYLPHFDKWAASKRLQGLDVVVLDDGSTDNDNRLGAVKDIEFAIEKLSLDDDLLVLAGDNVMDFSFNSFVAYYEQKQTTCIMRYRVPGLKGPCKFGVATVDENGSLNSIPLGRWIPWTVSAPRTERSNTSFPLATDRNSWRRCISLIRIAPRSVCRARWAVR